LLKKSLYGLKQSLRQGYHQFDEFLVKAGFVRSNYDSCVYMMRRNEKVIIYFILYVDDILMASSDRQEIQKLKKKLNDEFKMKDLGNTKRILGMDIMRDRNKGELFLSQRGVLEESGGAVQNERLLGRWHSSWPSHKVVYKAVSSIQ